MNFASYNFWSLLFICYLCSQIFIKGASFISKDAKTTSSKLCLAATGLILLGAESWLTLLVFLWVVSLSWIGVILAGNLKFKSHRYFHKITFILLLAGQLAPLVYYKYWNFIINELLGLKFTIPSVAIPMGLSFYTFQKIGFWIDTLRNPSSRPRFLDYLNFCSFFPQIVAGPIEKRSSLLPQIEVVKYKIHLENIEPALKWIILGLAYKMAVADNIGDVSHKLVIDSSDAWQVWFECFIFSIRIYFDFAGYSFIAVGLGLLLGVHLSHNFKCPYWSVNLREFWRNWHITLGAWLRDYVYITLGGRRSKYWIVNTLIVFLVSGLWHGAGLGFLIWGLMHGVGVVVCGLKSGFELPASISWAVTILYTTLAWLFFFENDPVVFSTKAATLINPFCYGSFSLNTIVSALGGISQALTAGMILSVAIIFLVIEGLGIRSKLEPYQILRSSAASMLLTLLLVAIAPMEESQFIYFNF
jgi:alginate O-acetyltransferase complex protein AlgI